MKKRMSWYWALPGAVGLALVMAAVLLLVTTAGRTPTASAQADCTLTITKAADVAIAPIGGSVVYTLTVHNTGLGACTNPTVVDDLADHLDCTATTQPTGWTATADNGCTGAAGAAVTWTAATLATGATATFTLTATISGAANADQIANSATVDANATGLPDLVTSNSVTVTVNDCDLTISKDSDDNEVGEGGQIVYTIHVENQGTEDCEDVIISETIPDDTDCIATDVIEANSDVDIANAEGCDTSGDVTWEVTEGTLDGLEPSDEAEVEMTVKLTSGANDGDEIDNEACVVSDDSEEICDTLTVDVEGVAATATPTTAPTATRGPTVQPIPTVIAPPPIPTARPLATIAPPITGTGPGGGSGPLAAGLALVGACLLLVSGATLVKRAR